MLNPQTKARINEARNILVGKVPDPKSQVEQITIALIYKFMDDMDAEAEELGGRRQFFAGKWAHYGWSRLMRAGLGGHEVLALYAEAIATMPQNPGVPALFRDIFKNAYLPYRDPETLRAFLKVIDEFTYDHSERLGDAFEYLLSVMDSQGAAGQFRTPRHIIDFMVEIIAPQKHETVLDPACGTAGFLISSYKHILRANDGQDGRPVLTPDAKARLVNAIHGYDISPDMVRLSLVNLYLHGFTAPRIDEYDTLTSQDRWNERADVILANPPFMSPKGGIKPHNRFGVQSKRSEVLFVDYIAEHLTPGGRAAVIVPEGIVFQSQTAYKKLRKMLVEDYLVAVISLPAGVFQPYSGVKTSILILDAGAAKGAGHVAFFKVGSDGFSTGAQRRPVAQNDLPAVQAELGQWLQALRQRGAVDALVFEFGQIVPKARIAEGGDYNLSGERYREEVAANSDFPNVPVREVTLEIKAGFATGKSSVDAVGVPHIRPMNIAESGTFTAEGTKFISDEEYEGREGYALRPDDVLFNNTNSVELVGKTCLIETPIDGGYSNHLTRIRVDKEKCLPRFLAAMLHFAWKKGVFIERATRWVGQAGVNTQSLSDFEIPLPPIEIQKEIVAGIEGYQKVIDGARAVLKNYRTHVSYQPDWPLVPLGELFETKSGTTPLRAELSYFSGGEISWVKTLDLTDGPILKTDESITEKALQQTGLSLLPVGTVLVAMYGGFNQIGRTGVLEIEATHNQAMTALLPTKSVDPYFLNAVLVGSRGYWKSVANSTRKDPNITKSDVLAFKMPLPPLETQRAIVAVLDAEQALVNANRELIARMQARIQATLARVWDKASMPEAASNAGTERPGLGAAPSEHRHAELAD